MFNPLIHLYSQGKISTLHGHQMGIRLQWEIKKILLPLLTPEILKLK